MEKFTILRIEAPNSVKHTSQKIKDMSAIWTSKKTQPKTNLM